jgi:hypothetical protein
MILKTFKVYFPGAEMGLCVPKGQESAKGTVSRKIWRDEGKGP